MMLYELLEAYRDYLASKGDSSRTVQMYGVRLASLFRGQHLIDTKKP